MEFRIQDILKNIIPGVLLITSIGTVFYFDESNLDQLDIDGIKDFSEFYMVMFLAVVYFTGFIIDALASILEGIVYKLVSRPSFMIFSNRAPVKYRLTNRDALMGYLYSKSEIQPIIPLSKEQSRTLFKVANRLKDLSNSEIIKERILETYNSYVFARNITCVCIISWLFCLVKLITNFESIVGLFLIQSSILAIVLIRLIQRAYYHSLQVLNAVEIRTS